MCYQEIVKNGSSGLVRKFTIKRKLEFNSRAVFSENFFYLLLIFSHLQTIYLHIKIPLIINLVFSLVVPNEIKILLQGIAHVVFVFNS